MRALHVPHLQTPTVLSVAGLLRPHGKAMTMAVAGIAVTELLEPRPIKSELHDLQFRQVQPDLGVA